MYTDFQNFSGPAIIIIAAINAVIIIINPLPNLAKVGNQLQYSFIPCHFDCEQVLLLLLYDFHLLLYFILKTL